jgi:hypothetical protein
MVAAVAVEKDERILPVLGLCGHDVAGVQIAAVREPQLAHASVLPDGADDISLVVAQAGDLFHTRTHYRHQ